MYGIPHRGNPRQILFHKATGAFLRYSPGVKMYYLATVP